MGAWGEQPWDNDTAADWFAGFFEGVDVDARIAASLANDDEDGCDEIRAACYILQTLGRVYVWPGDLDKLGEHLRAGIAHLESMIDPKHAAGQELREMWGEESEVFASIRRQRDDLQTRLAEGNWGSQ